MGTGAPGGIGIPGTCPCGGGIIPGYMGGPPIGTAPGGSIWIGPRAAPAPPTWGGCCGTNALAPALGFHALAPALSFFASAAFVSSFGDSAAASFSGALSLLFVFGIFFNRHAKIFKLFYGRLAITSLLDGAQCG